jgi:hypothetical protein
MHCIRGPTWRILTHRGLWGRPNLFTIIPNAIFSTTDLALTHVVITIVAVNVDSIGASKDGNYMFTGLVRIVSKQEVPQGQAHQKCVERCCFN